jgi:autotransporter-associated beta strand protein
VAPPGFSHVYRSIQFYQGGFHLYGEGIFLNHLYAAYPAGTNSTVHLDVLPYQLPNDHLTIEVVTNNSSLVIAGNLGYYGWTVPIHVVGAGDVVISGRILGGGNLVKTGTGDLTLSGLGSDPDFFHNSTTDVRGGRLRLNTAYISVGNLSIGSGSNGPVSAVVLLEQNAQIYTFADVTILGSGQLDLNGHFNTVSELLMTGGSVVTGAGSLGVSAVRVYPASSESIISGNLAMQQTFFSILTGARLRISAVISGGSAVLHKYEGGEMVLENSNTYDGPTVIHEGTLTVSNSRGLGNRDVGTTLEGGALRLNNVAIVGEPLTVAGSASLLNQGGSNFWSGDFTLNTNLSVMVSNANTLVLSNSVAGNGDLIKYELGTLKLTGTAANTSTGRTIVARGTLLLSKTGQNAVSGDLIVGDGAGGPEADVVQLDGAWQIADSSAVEVMASGLLDLRGFNETIRQLTGSGVVNLPGRTLIVSNETDHVFHGTIRGGGSLRKDGPGTWTLAGSNTYEGFTWVDAGTLLVNGTLADLGIAVAAGATMGGTGTVQRVSFGSKGGKLCPGASVGRLQTERVTMAGGLLEIELNGLAPGTGYDQLVTTAAPSLAEQPGKASGLKVIPGFTPAVGDRFVIINNQSSNAVNGTFSGRPEGDLFIGGNLVFQISYTGGDGNDVVITRVAVLAVSNFVASASGGQIQLQAQGMAGLSYVLEATPHLNAPVPWQPIKTNLAANGTGLIQFTDADMPAHAQRFYRLASP